MHGLQVIPVVGYMLAVLAGRGCLSRSVGLVWTYAIGYAGVALAMFVVALAGEPVISP